MSSSASDPSSSPPDALAAFRGEGEESDHREDDRRVSRTLLLFEFDGSILGVQADRVDAVIPWRDPAPLPSASASVAGVVQDRGRIVAVLRTPLAATSTDKKASSRRILVCATQRGFLGLPADSTRGVLSVDLASEPAPGELVDSSQGPLAYVDPNALIGLVLGGTT
jgi:chemotaxis signal transduction protein